MPWMKPFPFLCPEAPNDAAVVPAAKEKLLPPPSFTLVVRPKSRSGSAEADPAYRAGSSRGFCHHMADPGPAASPGVTHVWIRVMILSIRSPRYPSTPSMTTQMLFQQIPENVNYSRETEVGINAEVHFNFPPRNMLYFPADVRCTS